MQLAANVTPGDDLDWHAIDWKRSYRIVKNLRQRIFGLREMPLLEYVNCLSRVRGDPHARFCGEGVVAISPPYPTTYRMIDEAKKGSIFYRFILSPDPNHEDKNHDLDMRDITYQTMQSLEERVHQPILWVGAIHADHAPHLHAHVIAVVPKRLYVKDFQHLRQEATRACWQQRRFLDLAYYRERERPYQVSSFAKNPAYTTPRRQYRQGHVSGGSLPAPLRTCTCPRCFSVHVHNLRDPVHSCSSCGLILHRQKQLTLTLQRKEAGWQR